jgi:hypothetical protein
MLAGSPAVNPNDIIITNVIELPEDIEIVGFSKEKSL